MLTPYGEEIIRLISADVDATGKLLIIYFTFVKYLKNNRNTMKQCISYL
jgi:hypothetical protein